MYTSDIENWQHWSLLEHRRRQITDVDVVKNGICKPHYRGRQRAAVAERQDSGERPPMESYVLGPPVTAARAELGGWITAGMRLSRWRDVVTVGGLAR